MPKEADVPPQQGKPEKGAGEKNDEKKVEPFHLKEKIEEMVDYGYPLTMSFPRKDRELADELKKSILTIYRLSIEIDRKYFKKTTTQNLDVELDVLRGMVRLAASKKLHGGKYPPPLTMHQYEVWAKYNEVHHFKGTWLPWYSKIEKRVSNILGFESKDFIRAAIYKIQLEVAKRKIKK